MKKLKNKNALIAVIVIASLAVLYWGIEFLKGVNLFKPSNFYVAKFHNVSGLNISSPVMVNGFQVGLVREMNYDYKTNEIAVEMSLDEKLQIPMGSTVTLSSELLGAASLVINLSDQKVYHKRGDTLISETKQGLMEKVGKDMMPEVEKILPQVNDILTNINTLTSNPALSRSVGRFDPITFQLAQSAQQLNTLMQKLNGIVGSSGSQIEGVFTNVNGITGQLQTTAGKLDATMNNVQDLTGHLDNTVHNLPLDQLGNTINQLNATLANLEQLTAQLNEKLNSNNSSIGLLMNDRALYDNANSTVMSLDSLFKDIKKNPKRYVTIKVF